MITSKSLRWSGATISNGRQRLTGRPLRVRCYSLNSSSASSLYTNSLRSRHLPSYKPCVQQLRSISLLGWGSSTPKDADFAKLHTPKESSIHNDALGYDGQILAQKAAGESRSIPAVHQTSDSPSTNPLPPDSEPIPNETVSSPLDQIVSPPAESPLSETFESAEAFSCIPERIGYLKEVCGIDFGWGTSSMMEFILEHIHITGGFSWTTSIILLALLNRMVIFIPQLRSSSMGAMYKAKKSLFEPIQEKMRAAAKAKDTAKFAEHRAELNALKKETGFSLMKMFLSPALQIVLQFSAFRTLRNMSALPVPAFKHENWLWAQDLTSSDPYFIIPIANSAILYLTIKRGGETGTTQIQGPLLTTLSFIMPAFSFIFLCFQPGAVQLFFFTSAMLAFTQGRLLLNNSFRAKLGIHPLVLTPKTPAIDAVIKYATTTNTSTPTDTPSPANPPIQATNVPLGPGGLKLYQPPRPTSSSPSAAPKPAGTPTAPKDVSMIDKYVDKFKAHKEEVMGSLYKMMGTTKEERTKQSRRDKVVRDAESYEKRAALTAERRREERNEKVIGTSGRGRRGGMD